MLPVFSLWCEIVNLVASLFPVDCIQTHVSDSLSVTSLKEIYLKIQRCILWDGSIIFVVVQ